DLAAALGTITGIIGANGSGKSTLLKVLAGVTPADTGFVRVLGDDPTRRPSALEKRVGYVAQSVELDPEMTGLETLLLFATLHGISSPERISRAQELVDGFGLREHAARLVAGYSGGMRQRVHIAVGLVHRPEVLLLDEPTIALDPRGRADVWQMLQSLRDRGQTAVTITHD